MPQSLDVLPICGQPQTLLDDGTGGVVLHVEQVLHVPGHLIHTGAQVGALKVRHGLMVLLPHGVLLIVDLEEHDRHLDGGGEAALTQGSEGDECHLLDGAVELTADDGPHPRLCGVQWYHQADLTHVQAMVLR
jgi:hypothetical protein